MSRLERLESLLNLELESARGTTGCGASVARTLSRRGGVRAGTAEGLSTVRLGLPESGASESLASLSVGASESVPLCSVLSSIIIRNTRIASWPKLKNEKKYY
jgi:hypothetical protein